MPSFFAFQQGIESNTRLSADASPLLGRFRAVPGELGRRHSASKSRNSGLFGSYGATFARAVLGGDDDGDGGGGGDDGTGLACDEDELLGCVGRARRWLRDVWVRPQQGAVRRLVGPWWSRWLVLVVLPAAITVGWCAIPFPQYALPDDDDDDGGTISLLFWQKMAGKKSPGHGEARVQVNFWFFLFVYYGFYNLTALMWITKVFNIYSLNWWPESIGFPITVSTIAAISMVAPIPVYYFEETRSFLLHNTAWILWTFVVMAMPVAVALGILMNHERHMGLRVSLSETQRIFTQSWWTNETDVDTWARRDRRRMQLQQAALIPDSSEGNEPGVHIQPPIREAVRLRKLWIPASFMRFMWFCLALFIGLLAYVLGETYAEIYLRTLPHNNMETIAYVYSWVATIHILDWLTGWILGGAEGERVGSYPLGWIFKLYYSLTYQTYVRALYARLRSPSAFLVLQLLSSTSLILFHPLSMSSPFHSVLRVLGFNDRPYSEYKKYCGRSIFIRNLAESVSMLAFLGQILVLHFGVNREVYPYFAFDQTDLQGDSLGYDFQLTFFASTVTWACELVAAFIVRRIVSWVYKFEVTKEGRSDLGAWPELFPTGVAVMVHVLQNMLFGIIRLNFR